MLSGGEQFLPGHLYSAQTVRAFTYRETKYTANTNHAALVSSPKSSDFLMGIMFSFFILSTSCGLSVLCNFSLATFFLPLEPSLLSPHSSYITLTYKKRNKQISKSTNHTVVLFNKKAFVGALMLNLVAEPIGLPEKSETAFLVKCLRSGH